MVYVSPFDFFCRGVLTFWMHFLGTNKTISQIFNILNYSSMACQLQSFTGYLGQALVFLSNSALRQWSNFCFPGDFCWCCEAFIPGGGDYALGNNSVKF